MPVEGNVDIGTALTEIRDYQPAESSGTPPVFYIPGLVENVWENPHSMPVIKT